MTWLLPQLSRRCADQLIERFNSDPLNCRFEGFDHPQRFYQASGGDRLTDNQLHLARQAIVALAEEFGFPQKPPLSTRNRDYAEFEYRVAEFFSGWSALAGGGEAIPAETTRRDWWSYLTLVALPDVACWRWVSETQGNQLRPERFLGGGRNTFQRIHRRLLCLDRGASSADRFGLIRDLKEDDFSAILERPSLSSCPRVAVVLGEELLLMRERLSDAGWSLGRQQDVYRQSIKDLCAFGIVMAFDLLDADQLRLTVRGAFTDCEFRFAENQTGRDSQAQGAEKGFFRPVRKLFSLTGK